MGRLHFLAKRGLFLTFCICDSVSGGHGREDEGESQGLPAAGGLYPVHMDKPGPVMLGMYLTCATTSQPKERVCYQCWSASMKCK